MSKPNVRETVEHGAGSEVMDRPLESLAWFINGRLSQGGALEAGEDVSTGSCTPAHFVDVGANSGSAILQTAVEHTTTGLIS